MGYVPTHIRENDSLKAGYEGWIGDDVEQFQGPHDLPSFPFDNLLGLAQDNPYTEVGVLYRSLSGKLAEWNWSEAGGTGRLLVQDICKARKN